MTHGCLRGVHTPESYDAVHLQGLQTNPKHDASLITLSPWLYCPAVSQHGFKVAGATGWEF